jgi:NitT/TauT family transport system permease protein
MVNIRATHRWHRLLALGLFLLAWQLVAMLLKDEILPSPTTVWAAMLATLASGEMLEHMAITLLRVGAAFIIALGAGSLIGIMMGRSRRLNAAFDALLVIGLNLPALVVIFLCYIWFGLTEFAAILAVAVNKIPNTAVTMREGARAVDDELMQVAQAFRLSRRKTLFRVFLPQLYPYLMASARSGLALVWKIVLVVELLGRSNGVGFILGTYFQYFDIASILAYTIAFAGVIMLIEWLLLDKLDQRLERWRYRAS